jgi:hypothetical protein
MNDPDLKNLADIIRLVRYPVLATISSEGIPWNTPFEQTRDEDLNIYLVSDKENQHSQNIRATGKGFIVIYNSTVEEGGEKGVYIQVDVSEMTEPVEIARVRRLKKPDYDGTGEEFLGEARRRYYKAVPLQVWTNDAEYQGDVFIRDFRAEVPLEALKSLLNQ